MVNRGDLTRIKKGRYVKPLKTKFGPILASDRQILNSLLQDNGNVKGYVAGVVAYNGLGLTSQTSADMIIATTESPRYVQIGKLNVRYILARGPLNEETIKLLPLLDALKDIKNIPDAGIDETINRIRSIIKDLQPAQKKLLSELSKRYPPRVNAVLGAIFESLDESELAKQQKQSLNPLSRFDIGVSKNILSNKDSWNIR